MAGDDDIEREIAAALPAQPQPATARREAAIGAAMRRFDAIGEAVPPARLQKQSPSLQRLLQNRPQLAGLVAISLVLIVGAPIAWRELNRSTSPIVAPADRKPVDAAVPPPRVASPRVAMGPAPNNAPPLVRSSPPSSSNAAATASQAASPPPPAQMIEPAPPVAPVMMPPPPSAAAPAIDLAPKPPSRLAVREAGTSASESRAAATSSPPPPAAPRDVALAGQTSLNAAPTESAAKPAESADNESVIVTASRRRSGGRSYFSSPGDWNACTIDDPRQSLAACRFQIHGSAHGTKGEAAAFLTEGLTRAWQGEGQRAIAAFDQAIALAPGLSLAWLNRGLARANAGDDAGALADLDRAVRLASYSARAHYARGRLLRARGDDERAEAEFERAAELDPAYDELND